MAFEHTFAEWAPNGVKSAPSEALQETGFLGGMKPPASVFNYQWDKTGKAITELQEAEAAVEAAIAEQATQIGNLGTEVQAAKNATAPYKFIYDTDGDVLGMVRDVASYTKTKTYTPYNIEGDNITDKGKGYADSTNESYAELETTTESRTAKIYIDLEIPPTATISALTINAKIGTSNISSAVWTTHTYSIKSGSNVLGSGDFTLKTLGNVISLTVTDMTKIVSPIIVIELTAQTTVTQYVRIFGADVSITYSAAQEFVSLIRQNKLASDSGSSSEVDASKISGVLAVENGGTGADNAEEARENLGITPENIGAAKSDLSNASGTLGGQVVANATAVATLGTAQVRNTKISATDLTAGSSALATGDSYHVYE